MLTQITPPVAHAAVLYDSLTAPWAALMMHAIEDAAPSLGVAVRAAPCGDDAGIEATMSELAAEQHGGGWFCRTLSAWRAATPWWPQLEIPRADGLC